MTIAASGDLDETVERSEVSDNPVHIDVDSGLDTLSRCNDAGIGLSDVVDALEAVAGDDTARQEKDLTAWGRILEVFVDVESGLSSVQDDQPLPNVGVLGLLNLLG